MKNNEKFFWCKWLHHAQPQQVKKAFVHNAEKVFMIKLTNTKIDLLLLKITLLLLLIITILYVWYNILFNIK